MMMPGLRAMLANAYLGTVLPIRNLLLTVAFIAPLAAQAQSTSQSGTSMLRVACDGDDVGAEVSIDGVFKGECPVDMTVRAGTLKLRMVKKLGTTHERVFEQEIRMGDGTVKKIEARLGSEILTAEGRRIEAEKERINAERERKAAEERRQVQEAARLREEERQREIVAAERKRKEQAELLLANLKAQGVESGNGKPFRDCADCPEMVLIPAGQFTMGGSVQEQEQSDWIVGPQHRVNVPSFTMGKTEVTQGQWKAVMGINPSWMKSGGEDYPVEQVSWNDVQTFIQKLNASSGKQFRLPSESEWEYACRAGVSQTYCGSDAVGDVAVYVGNNRGSKSSVAGKQANAWGLFDMSGSVWEWVDDWYHENYSGAPTDGSAWVISGEQKFRVKRGGSRGNSPDYLRSTFRFKDFPGNRDMNTGFRLARTLP